MKDKLDKMQKEVDEMFAKNNNELNDEILEKQVEINELRNEHNIPDKSEMVYQNYVQ